MFEQTDFDLIVIGSGAGGAVGASYARGLGKSVALFEKDKVLGGECPNWACVPTKALLQAAEVYQSAKNAGTFGVSASKVTVSQRGLRAWRNKVVSRTGAAQGDAVFTDEGIKLIKGRAKFVSADTVESGGKTYSAKRFLVATGADPLIPQINGLKQTGFINFKQAAEIKSLPKSILILGGGPIGCEFAQLYADLGVKVTITEAAARLLPREEPEVGQLIAELFGNRGIDVLLGCKVNKIERKAGRKIAYYKGGKVASDEILVAAGKQANLGFGEEAAGIKVDDGKIRTNDKLQTTNSRVFVAGDNSGGMQFTHVAAYQSRMAVHNAFNRRQVKPTYTSIPRCIFIRPEVASVGFSEDEAKKRGITIKKGITPTAIVGRANTSNEFDGFVKVITDKRGVIIGASIVSPRAGELIHELALAIKLRATASEVAELVHAFPTYSEAIKIACAGIS